MGKSDAEQQKNFKKIVGVFCRSQWHDIGIKVASCNPLWIVGHIVDSQGLHATKMKVWAVIEAPVTKIISEFQAFLVLWYSKFPNNFCNKTKGAKVK